MTHPTDIDTQIESILDDLWDTSGLGRLTRNWYGEEKLELQLKWKADAHKAIKALLIQSKIDELESLKEAQSLWSHSGEVYCKGANARKADIDKQIKQRKASLKRELT